MVQSSSFLENSLLTSDKKNIKYFFISLKEPNIVVNTYYDSHGYRFMGHWREFQIAFCGSLFQPI